MRATILAASIMLLAVTLPVEAGSNVHARNVTYLWTLVGDVPADTPATMPDGRTIPLAQALDETAARAGSIDLAAIVSGAGSGSDTYVGDIWLLSLGTGPCTVEIISPSPVPNTAFHPQAYTYHGAVGTMSGEATNGLLVMAWSMKVADGYYERARWELTGQSDFYCISFGGVQLAFPFVNGIVQVYPS